MMPDVCHRHRCGWLFNCHFTTFGSSGASLQQACQQVCCAACSAPKLFLVSMLFSAKSDTGCAMLGPCCCWSLAPAELSGVLFVWLLRVAFTTLCLSSGGLPLQQLVSLTCPLHAHRCVDSPITAEVSQHAAQLLLLRPLTCSLPADMCSQRRLIPQADPTVCALRCPGAQTSLTC